MDWREAIKLLIRVELLAPNALMDWSYVYDDPGADFGPGELARIGKALDILGKQAIKDAKVVAAPMMDSKGFLLDDGVEFQERGGGVKTVLDKNAIEAIYPKESNPSHYKKQPFSGSVAVKVPVV